MSPMRSLGKRWGAEVWFKREDLAHTGAHKINNALGQVLLAKRMGAKRIVAETGAGQHGVATAAACARVGLPCVVYMGEVDMERQAPNVGRMRLMGATVVPVTSGDRTLRAAIDEAFRDWVADPTSTFYCLGSAVGPHPYPYLVRELQAIIGREARAQILEKTGALPDCVIACVGGGSNAIGTFHAFLGDPSVEIIGVEAGGRGPGLGDNAATLATAGPACCMGPTPCCCRTRTGRSRKRIRYRRGSITPASVPSMRCCARSAACQYIMALDDDALACVEECATYEGILPAIESAHALSGARDWAKRNPGKRVLVGLSGRGDKDMPTLQKTLLVKHGMGA